MKAMLFFIPAAIVLLAACVNAPPVNKDAEKADDFARARESGNLSDNGAISLYEEGAYLFTIILVKDLEWALKSLEIAD